MKRSLLLTLILFTAGFAKAETISISDYLKDVNGQNLTLKASDASVDAADARSAGVKIPEPMVAITQMRDESGSSNGYEINQTIPFPTKLTSDRKARKLEVEMEKANALGLKKEVLAKARLLYISAWSAQERIGLLKEKRSVIQQHLRLSTASTRSDSSLRIHTLKTESDLDILETEILEAEQVLKEQWISLAEFAKKDPTTYRPTLSQPPVTQIPDEKSLSRPSQIEAKRLNLERLGARESEAQSSWLPDFSVRYRDIGGTPMTPGYREVMVGATLPFVFFWEPHATSKSAKAERMKAEAEYSQERLTISAKTSSLLTRAESLKKQLGLVTEKLIPRAEKRMKLVHNLAPRDMESLQEHREGMEAFPDLKLKALDLRLQYEAAVVELSAYSTEVAQ